VQVQKISLKSCAWTHVVCKHVHTSLALNSSQSAFCAFQWNHGNGSPLQKGRDFLVFPYV